MRRRAVTGPGQVLSVQGMQACGAWTPAADRAAADSIVEACSPLLRSHSGSTSGKGFIQHQPRHPHLPAAHVVAERGGRTLSELFASHHREDRQGGAAEGRQATLGGSGGTGRERVSGRWLRRREPAGENHGEHPAEVGRRYVTGRPADGGKVRVTERGFTSRVSEHNGHPKISYGFVLENTSKSSVAAPRYRPVQLKPGKSEHTIRTWDGVPDKAEIAEDRTEIYLYPGCAELVRNPGLGR